MRLALERIFEQGYEVFSAKDGVEVLEIAKANEPDLAILDILMPKKDGIEAMRELHALYPLLPVILLTGMDDILVYREAFYRGCEDFFIKPVEMKKLLSSVRKALKFRESAKVLLPKDSLLSIARSYGRIVSCKDEYTGNHSERVAIYALVIAKILGLSNSEVTKLLVAALSHDIGKIGVPDNILLKPGNLNKEEWAIMRNHAQMTKQILDELDLPGWDGIPLIAASHHEAWMGGGYPNGLKGEEIPLSGRILALADVFDALTTKRSYKEAFPLEKTFEIIRNGSGTQFDPAVVAAFFKACEKGEILNLLGQTI
jgi:putative two-component system response regulator